MPKRVDHQERRQRIAAALLRVVSNEGLGEVSLRHVAAEAGVTAGMVQHYFPSKDAMVQFAMGAASERYEQRITGQLAALGAEPEPLRVIRTLVGGLIPTTAAEAEDARVALAFQAYAVNDSEAAGRLGDGNRMLTEHIGHLLTSIRAGGPDPRLAAMTLLAVAEGLAVAVLSAGMPAEAASRALDFHIGLLQEAPSGRR